MKWPEARKLIEDTISVGDDVNTEASAKRRVLEVNAAISNASYGYDNERGYIVSIGDENEVQIPWFMLEKCFDALITPEGYSGKVFRQHYKKQAVVHGCHVHVVGMLFVKATIAALEGRRYTLAPEHRAASPALRPLSK